MVYVVPLLFLSHSLLLPRQFNLKTSNSETIFISEADQSFVIQLSSMSTYRSVKMEQKDYYSPPAPVANRPGIIRVTRDLPPAHYLFQINSFSLLAEEESIEKYESGLFEAGGYKWRLLLYPKGNKKRNGDGCISLYLQIADTETLPLGWQINVNFKFFVFDQIRDKYLTIEDAGAVKRFHQMKTEWGFDQLLLLGCFNDASNGYLVDDSCTFGAEVFIIEQKASWECVSMIKQPNNNTISFKIENFSNLDEDSYESPLQSIAGFKWKLVVYPYGDSSSNSAVSIFLSLAEASGVPPKRRLYVNKKLRVMDQISSNHWERSSANWFTTKEGGSNWGYSNFISLEKLRDESKGFLVEDAFIVEAEIVVMSKLKCAS
ncbi:hypothetical protein PTKIN_Ptkin15bG0018400 [Pterospermum kingtungense]